MKRRIVITYIISAIILSVVVGLVALMMARVGVKESEIKIAVDVASTISGSIWLTFLLSRIISRDFETVYDGITVQRLLAISTILIIARIIGMLMQKMINTFLITGILDLMLDVLAVFIIIRLIKQKKDVLS